MILLSSLRPFAMVLSCALVALWGSTQNIAAKADEATAPSQIPAEDAPEIPPLLPVEAFGALPAFVDLTLSPDGQNMAYMAAVDGRWNVAVQPVKGGIAKGFRIPPIRKANIAWFRWANPTRLLVAYEMFDRDIYYGARTETRLIAFDLESKKSWNVLRSKPYSRTGFRPVGQIETRIVDILRDDPDHILMSLNPDRDATWGVYKVNVDTRRQSTVQGPLYGITRWLVDHNHMPRYGAGYKGTKRRILYKDPASGDWGEVRKSDWFEAGFSPIAFFEDPAFAYAIGPVNGRRALVKLNIPEGDIVEALYAHDKVDIDGVIEDSAGLNVIGVTYTEDYRRIHYFDEFHKQMQTKIDELLPDTVNRIVDELPDKKLYLILAHNDRIEGDYYALDLIGKQLYYIASQRGLDERLMAEVTPVSYAARDGLEIPAYLTLPKGRTPKNLPTIILPHGGPHSRDTQDFHYLSQFLANRGYAVLRPNFRGSSGYGKKFRNMGKKQWGGAMQDDVTDGANWMIEQGIADPKRMCIVGWSYGGYAALMGAIKTPELFACAASINGVTNLPDIVEYDRGFVGGLYWSKLITNDEEGRKAVSPHHQAKRIKIPIFLASAKDDVSVPNRQSKRLYAKLKKQVPTTYIEIKAGGHSLDHEQGRIKMLKGLEKFLAENIGAENLASD